MVSLALVLSNALGFILQLLLPLFLIPAQYAAYSVSIAFSQLLLVLFYEWIRLPLLRFAYDVDSYIVLTRRKLFIRVYAYVTGVALLIAVFAWLFSELLPLGAYHRYLAVALIIVAAQGSFEGAQSYSRANFKNRIFSFAWVLRSFLTLAMCVAIAQFTNDGILVAIAYAISFFASLVIFYLRPRRPNLLKGSEYENLPKYAKYGVALALASFISAMGAPFLKQAHINVAGEASSGGVFLIFDISFKVFAIMGMAINLLYSQKIILKIQQKYLSRAHDLAILQIHSVIATICPVAISAILLDEAIINNFVPAAYRIDAAANFHMIVLIAALLAAKMFSSDAVFIILSETRLAFATPLLTLILWGLGLMLVGNTGYDLLATFLAALVVSYLGSILYLFRRIGTKQQLFDLVFILFCAISMLLLGNRFLAGSMSFYLKLGISFALGLTYFSILFLKFRKVLSVSALDVKID